MVGSKLHAPAYCVQKYTRTTRMDDVCARQTLTYGNYDSLSTDLAVGARTADVSVLIGGTFYADHGDSTCLVITRECVCVPCVISEGHLF